MQSLNASVAGRRWKSKRGDSTLAFDANKFVNQELEDMAQEVKHDPSHPMTQLLKCVMRGLQDAGGVWQPGNPCAVKPLWEDMGLELPTTYPSEECWEDKPTDREMLSDLAEHYSESEDGVYSSWDPRQPLAETPIATVWEQLHTPNLRNPIYAANVVSQAKMRIPDCYSGPPPYPESIQTTTNVTPRGTFVELHVGKGARVHPCRLIR